MFGSVAINPASPSAPGGDLPGRISVLRGVLDAQRRMESVVDGKASLERFVDDCLSPFVSYSFHLDEGFFF